MCQNNIAHRKYSEVKQHWTVSRKNISFCEMNPNSIKDWAYPFQQTVLGLKPNHRYFQKLLSVNDIINDQRGTIDGA